MPGRGGEPDKTSLRSQLRCARNAIAPDAAVEAAQAVAQRAAAFLAGLVAKAGLIPAQTPVALYAALPGELDGLPLLEALFAQNFPTLLPIAGAKATPLAFRLWRPGEPLVAGRYGLREPAASAPDMVPKLLIAPLLGFDIRGTRLGFGGGYYDVTLAALRAGGLIAAGGLAFSSQQAERIPREKHDEALDFVLTETELFDFTDLTDSSCASSSSAT